VLRRAQEAISVPCDQDPCPAIKEVMSQLAEIKELLLNSRKRPLTADREKFIYDLIKRDGYTCFSKAKGEDGFAELFPNSETFKRTALQLMSTYKFKVKDAERNSYYYRPDFDIDSIIKTAKWRRYRPDDHELIDHLAKMVYQADEPVNVWEYLETEYPDKGQDWRADVIDSLKGGKYRIRRGASPPGTTKRVNDWFDRIR
jgi:hypothetical protein